MQRLGRVLHVTPSRNMVIRVEVTPRIGEKVVDERLQRVGTVSDVFGPVSKPYVTIKTSVENPALLVSRILYINPSAISPKYRKEKRN